MGRDILSQAAALAALRRLGFSTGDSPPDVYAIANFIKVLLATAAGAVVIFATSE